MEEKIIFSDQAIKNNYYRLLRLLIYSNKNKFSSIKTAVRLKLVNKKFLSRLYKKLLTFHGIRNFLHSYVVYSYCLLKKYLYIHFPWILNIGFTPGVLLFFSYHFLSLYNAIFTIKMMMDWLPVMNWERTTPLKRFIRRVTLSWARQFEKYFHPILAWVMVLHAAPIILSIIKGFYRSYEFTNFPTVYPFEQTLEFVLESNLLPRPQRWSIIKTCPTLIYVLTRPMKFVIWLCTRRDINNLFDVCVVMMHYELLYWLGWFIKLCYYIYVMLTDPYDPDNWPLGY
uniref:Uncharacterized protein n=1 Tax=Eustigmatophyceae sp. Ndem 8/9T-3m6.8 TaxID=2506146 RepID=A0A3R5UA35_9STRA|nr:hypothetical protein Ycf19 [Eustigmatophyceae sp. Ndem 8/9T-3m6.8]QAA11871.1 hypothetical protein Ycf19 [Eustigmatophyceae sp. Ndem 8/9T-3m6.8]